MLWLLITCLLGVVVAEPHQRQTPSKQPGKNFCPSVKKIVTAFQQQKPASKYCSSYLKSTPATTTSTGTIPPTPGPCQASPVVSPAFNNAGNLLKKQPHEPKPKCFAGYTNKSILASACSCIVTPARPVTTTVTTTSGVLPLPSTPSTFRIQAINFEDSAQPEVAEFKGDYAGQEPDSSSMPFPPEDFVPDVYFNAPPSTAPAAPESPLTFTFVLGTNNLQAITSDILRDLVGERARGEVAGDRRLELRPLGREDTGPEPLVPVNCTIVPREDQTCTLDCIRPGFPADRTHIRLVDDGDAQWRISDTDTVDAERRDVRFKAIAVEVFEGGMS